jgi:UPF0042 nucleotide-binding protein
MELILVTGLCGAGRRSVMSTLEDLGCPTIQNVPVRLLEPLLELETKMSASRPRLAVEVDSRYDAFATEFQPVLDHLLDGSMPVHLVFVEADEAALLRRFSETRRPHPFAGDGGVRQGITRERAMMVPVRDQATAIVDTSRLTLSQLRQRITELLPHLSSGGPALRLFGFKSGIPADADMVLDARFLPNPHYVAELKPLTGKDQSVRDFLSKSDTFEAFLSKAEIWIRWCWPLIQQEGRAYFTVAIGCTGGQHRSVAIAEMLAQRLQGDIPKLRVEHRELG